MNIKANKFKENSANKAPSFGIALPCFNEEQNIGELLDLLCSGWNLDYRPDRICVFSSECTDRTDEIVRNFAAKSEIPVVLKTEKSRSGKCHAINQLIDMIGPVEVIILVSSDIQISGKELINMLKCFNQKDIGVVAGRPVPVCDKTNLAYRVTKVLWNIHHLMVLQDPKSTEVTAFRNLDFRLDEKSLVDEAEIEWNISRKGLLIKYCPNATIKNKAPQSLIDHIRQRTRVTLGHFILKKNKQYVVGSMKSKVRIKALIKYLRSEDSDLLAFIAFIAIEAWVSIAGYFLSLIRPSTEGKWARIESAKGKFI